MRVLIAYVYNKNGIATWCYEAARALIPYTKWCKIICLHSLEVPTDLRNYIIPYHPNAGGRSLFIKIKDRLKDLFQWILPVKPDSKVLKQTIESLALTGQIPDIILVCQPNFIAPELKIPQWVVARTYPTSAQGYFGQMAYPSDLAFFKRLLFFWYWYRMDNKGYRLAGKVITLTDALAKQLTNKGILAHRVYPGVTGLPFFTPKVYEGPVRYVTAALSLEEKRKNIAWLVQALNLVAGSPDEAVFTLLGEYSGRFFKDANESTRYSLSFSGFVNRSQLLETLSTQEIFLFASFQENWGYVLVEAMAFGCAVFAPDQYPFNEIVGRKDYLYQLGDLADFREKLLAIIKDRYKLFEDRQWFFQRYQVLFSGDAFREQLIRALKPSHP